MIDKRNKTKSSNKKPVRVFRFLGLTINSLLVLVLGVLLGIVLGLLLFYVSMYLQAKRSAIVLPNYINLDSSVAVRELESLGFKVEVIGGPGKVIKMDPIPNMRVKVNRKVKLFTEQVTISKMQLPDFKYTWYKSVEKILKELRINTVVKPYKDAGIPGIYGTVLSTSPTAGTEVKSFNTVVLFINSQNTNKSVKEEQYIREVPESTTVESAVEVIPPSVNLDSPTVPESVDSPKLEKSPSSSPISLPEENNQNDNNQNTGNQEPALEGGQF
ncbi:MAG: PASTA domain-containing protein [Fervidobacterium sp.]